MQAGQALKPKDPEWVNVSSAGAAVEKTRVPSLLSQVMCTSSAFALQDAGTEGGKGGHDGREPIVRVCSRCPSRLSQGHLPRERRGCGKWGTERWVPGVLPAWQRDAGR